MCQVSHTQPAELPGVGVPGRERPNGSRTGDKKKSTKVMQKVKKAKGQVLVNMMASGTPVTGLFLLLARGPCKKEPGAWQLPSTAARFRTGATDRVF